MKAFILKITNAIALTLVVGWAAVLIGCSGSQATLKASATSSASNAEAEAKAKAKAEAAEAARAEAEAKKAEAEAKAKAAEAARAEAEAKAKAAAEQAAKARAFDGSVYFEYNSAVIRSDQKPVLTQLVEKLVANPGYRVKVGGYCDERGTPEYNVALGQKRADAVKKILVRKGKIAPERITTISYGKTRPADPDHDEKSWSKNRRAGFDLTGSSDKIETSQR